MCLTNKSRCWVIKTTGEVRTWLRALRQADPEACRSVNVAIDMLAEAGPGLGRPLEVATLSRNAQALGARLRIVFDYGNDLRQIA